jgi:tRNA (guanine-N7-)-methyltransferase
MPHLKIAPFAVEKLDALIAEDPTFDFRAVRYGSDRTAATELIGLEFEGESFALALLKRPDAWLLKPYKPTRPLDAGRIKRALRYVADSASLEVLHHNIHHAPTRIRPAHAFHKHIDDFIGIDFGDRSVVIEVGFGSGRHLLHQASRHPETLFIGIEIHTPSARQVLKQITLQGLENVWVVDYDARLLLEAIPSNVLETIYVHFPVPWDKKPHRRVIGSAFVSEALRALRPGGFLELRTDSERYYFYALEIFSEPESARFEVTKNHDAPVQSKYEARWRRMNKSIYTLRLFNDTLSEPIDATTVPTFDRPPCSVEEVLNLPTHSIVAHDSFVHFGPRFEMVTEEGVLVECSFGSFDRPEHKLIAVRRGSIEYYPHPPVPTRTNLAAHHTIGEYLYA